MRVTSIIWLILVGTAFGQAPIRYHVSFAGRDHHQASVTVTFDEIPASDLEVRMSRTSPGRYALHEFAKNVYDVKAVNGQGHELPATRPNPHQWNIAGHDGTVKITYTIFGDRCDGTYLAIDNTHAHINMPATFMWARGLEARPIEITFDVPEPIWKVATQLQATDRQNTYKAPNLAYFLDSPTEISDLSRYEWSIPTNGSTKTVELAIHHAGTQEEAAAYAELCKAVVAEAVATFHEAPDFDYGTYTFIADYLPYVNGDGMEHRNSTILTTTRPLKTGAVRNLGTVSHEFFHAWNVERIRPRSLEPFNFEEANMSGELWFAEGFTSYYGNLLLKRAQVTSLDRFAQSLSNTINVVLNAPGRQFFSPVEMSQQAPFVDAARSVDPKNFENTFISYYTYGYAIALGLDLTIRQRFSDSSLDGFMRAVWQKHGKTETPYTNENLQQILGQFTGDPDFADRFFQDYIYGRELVDYSTLLTQAGLILRQKDETKAWPGGASLSYQGDSVTVNSSTRIGSPLYLAGIDRQDVILELDGKTFEKTEELEELLKDYKPGDAVTIKYQKNGVEKTADLVFQSDPTLEVVPYEQAHQEISTKVAKFRQDWLGSQSEFDSSTLRRYCPECKRAFAFQREFCWYDGETLGLTPSREKRH